MHKRRLIVPHRLLPAALIDAQWREIQYKPGAGVIAWSDWVNDLSEPLVKGRYVVIDKHSICRLGNKILEIPVKFKFSILVGDKEHVFLASRTTNFFDEHIVGNIKWLTGTKRLTFRRSVLSNHLLDNHFNQKALKHHNRPVI